MRVLAEFRSNDRAAEDVRLAFDLLPGPHEVHLLVAVPHRALPALDPATGLAAPGDASPTPEPGLEVGCQSVGARSLSSIIDRLVDATGSVAHVVVHGNVVEAAATYVADKHFDVIVMHADEVVDRRVNLDDVPCPILLLPTGADSTPDR
jgi:hypothetical protein